MVRPGRRAEGRSGSRIYLNQSVALLSIGFTKLAPHVGRDQKKPLSPHNRRLLPH